MKGKEFLRFFYEKLPVLKKIYHSCRLVCSPLYYDSVSYFPRHKSKNKFFRLLEQVQYVCRNNSINENYFVCGFDVKNKKIQQEYFDQKDRELRDLLNRYSAEQRYNMLLKDKFLFGQYLESLGFLTPKNLFFINMGIVKDLNTKQSICLEAFFDKEFIAFCKPLEGAEGINTFLLAVSKGRVYIDNKEYSQKELIELFNKGVFLIQENIKQHSSWGLVHPESVNTIRLVTIYNYNTCKVELLSATVRFGIGANTVDNWAAGGVVVQVADEIGTLAKYGFFKPKFGTKISRHPDSKIQFSEIIIPNFQKIVDEAKKLHEFFYFSHTIGWDIAIGENFAPVFIEGNEFWDMVLSEINGPGAKQHFYKTIRKQ